MRYIFQDIKEHVIMLLVYMGLNTLRGNVTCFKVTKTFTVGMFRSLNTWHVFMLFSCETVNMLISTVTNIDYLYARLFNVLVIYLS